MSKIASNFLRFYEKHKEAVKLIAPHFETIQNGVGKAILSYCAEKKNKEVQCLEIGCGSGYTTSIILSTYEYIRLTAIDIDTQILEESSYFVKSGSLDPRLNVFQEDALSFLKAKETFTFNVVSSAMTFHNFDCNYRHSCLKEIYRVLKPGGLFVNADRYTQDPMTHNATLQRQVERCFDVFRDRGDYESLRDWVVHLISDESPDRIMAEDASMEEMQELGYVSISVQLREETDAVLVARKHK